MAGISSLHGLHQVAQKFSSTILPCRSESRTSWPCKSLSAISGAGLPSRGGQQSSDVLRASDASSAEFHNAILAKSLCVLSISNSRIGELVPTIDKCRTIHHGEEPLWPGEIWGAFQGIRKGIAP